MLNKLLLVLLCYLGKISLCRNERASRLIVSCVGSWAFSSDTSIREVAELVRHLGHNTARHARVLLLRDDNATCCRLVSLELAQSQTASYLCLRLRSFLLLTTIYLHVG